MYLCLLWFASLSTFWASAPACFLNILLPLSKKRFLSFYIFSFLVHVLLSLSWLVTFPSSLLRYLPSFFPLSQIMWDWQISFLRTFSHLRPWAWVLSSSLFEACSHCVPSSSSLPGLVAFFWGSHHFLFSDQFLFLNLSWLVKLRFRIIILLILPSGW